MSRYSVCPDRLFDRPWRVGHPYQPRMCRMRRWSMVLLLLVLCLIIGGYNYLTDAARVKSMAETYLSRLIGGRVAVGSARLSVFEGLRLDGVKVYVDEDDLAPDSLVFSAQTFVIKYNPRSIIAGDLEATQIVAQKPHVHLTENLDREESSRWNYQRLGHGRPQRVRPSISSPGKPKPPPELLLRNARVEITAVRKGRTNDKGLMFLDGQLAPSVDGEHYLFELQTRGLTEDVGPFARGSIDLVSRRITAQIHDTRFGHDLRSMLPADVRDWWERHDLSGHVDIPELTYAPPRGTNKGNFLVRTVLSDVTLALRREEWMSREEIVRLDSLRDAVGWARRTYRMAGYSVGLPALAAAPARPDAGIKPASAALSPIDGLASQLESAPLTMHGVAGTFLFSQDGIDVRDLTIQIENSKLAVAGHIGGYNPDAPASIHVTSPENQNLVLPSNPRYVNSLPKQVREVYDNLRPEGVCVLHMDLERPRAGVRPEVSGYVDVLDGTFMVRKFPYPVRNANGRIAFGRDPILGRDFIHLIGLRGRGAEDGPNRNTIVKLEGIVGPLEPNGVDPAMSLRITGEHVSSEERLRQAFPPDVRQALSIFDADGHGKFPTFHGSFVCKMERPAGQDRKSSFDTEITLEDGGGALVGFPYPLRHVRGKLKIRDGHAELINLTMRRNDADMAINGHVSWRPDTVPAPAGEAAGPGLHDVKMDIRVAVHNQPLDKELLAALPAERRDWLRKLGVGGKIDAEGRIYLGPAPDQAGLPSPARNIAYELAISLRDGTLWPAEGMFSLSNVRAKLRLTRNQVDLTEFSARRDKADITGSARLQWLGSQPSIKLDASVRNLALDSALYNLLPPAARKSWDQVQPEGAIDGKITYGGLLGGGASTEKPVISAVVQPHQLAVTVRALPYRLDLDGGTVTLTPEKIVLENVTGHHGAAKISASGSGILAGRPEWALRLDAENVAANDELRRALPDAMASLFDSFKLKGALGFHFPKLTYREIPAPADASASRNAAPHASLAAFAVPGPVTSELIPAKDIPEVELAGAITLTKASLDVGVPLEEVTGRVDLEATFREGRVTALKGGLDVASLMMAGHPVHNLRAEMLKPAGKTELNLGKLQASACGGELAGQVHLSFPEEGPSRYTMGLVVRNADMKEFAGDAEQDIRGDLTASLSLEGAWGDPSARRGRGDVLVAGKQMYQIPLILGLLQVTNLSLPIGGPFTKGTARYSVEGQRVNFEQIDLRADNMTMNGSGHLDFDTRKVNMTFATDNPGGFKIPFLHDLWQGARRELFTIHVRGTVQSPKVEAASMSSFTTTIDEVFKGDANKKDH